MSRSRKELRLRVLRVLTESYIGVGKKESVRRLGHEEGVREMHLRI